MSSPGTGARETEVEKLDAVFREEHVGGFQVAVQRSPVMERLERGENPPGEAAGLRRGKGPAFQAFRE